jgi:hypothetical protein
MDVASIEGYHYRPNTTALEAQRIGLEVIRRAVGDDVLIDKDGSPMLSPVGIVDAGRISHDTSHSFAEYKTVEPGIAARFYMNRNYFLADPDAFNVATPPPTAPSGGGGGFGGPGSPGGAGRQVDLTPQTLSEAQCSIVMSAVSGGMYEIGDDLPTLSVEKDRLDLVRNPDLIDMAKINRASTPVDLLSYDPADEQPSIFFLREDPRQSILVVFNWTDQSRSHTLKLADFGLPVDHTYQGSDVLNAGAAVAVNTGTVELTDMPKHSVQVIKLIDPAVSPAAPKITAQASSQSNVGQILPFSVRASEDGVPALSYHWDFGDGTTADGAMVNHAFTRDADFTVQLTVMGLDGLSAQQSFTVKVTGIQATSSGRQNTRYEEPANQ